ncbi:MAG TPA: hypothetical protein VGY99_19890 [Candidatus Binataceae bacterium]|jgi:hypothetical protein|nr:hypothetical protein [Candidatus Binataceae bacterium]
MEHNEKSWIALLEASTWEFPLAVQKWMMGGDGGSQDVENITLKAYHAWVTLANVSVDRFCKAKGFCDLMTGSLNWLLQWQRLGRSIADTMAPGAMMGMRSGAGSEDHGRDEMLQRLSQEVRQLTARLNMQEGHNGFKTAQKVKAMTSTPRGKRSP